jgi:hypothetical protein
MKFIILLISMLVLFAAIQVNAQKPTYPKPGKSTSISLEPK